MLDSVETKTWQKLVSSWFPSAHIFRNTSCTLGCRSNLSCPALIATANSNANGHANIASETQYTPWLAKMERRKRNELCQPQWRVPLLCSVAMNHSLILIVSESVSFLSPKVPRIQSQTKHRSLILCNWSWDPLNCEVGANFAIFVLTVSLCGL